ncbi:hypothetical protein RCC89_04080 [Cytophagaceae bacterium ABcell3]|nr:hypothetical protein RCC89_04080 [Cytophagaceae bacterium ABcell3]
MKTNAIFLSLIFLFAFTACDESGADKKALTYYNSYSEILQSFTDDSQDIMEQINDIVQENMVEGEGLELSSTDSVKALGLLSDFKAIQATALQNLNALETFEDNDLKHTTVEYVDKSADILHTIYLTKVLGLEELAPEDDDTDELLEELEKISDNIVNVQKAFMNKYEIPIISEHEHHVH